MDACVEDENFDNNSFCPKSDVTDSSACPFRGESRSYEEVTYKWNDITTEFVEACSQLELGELFHDVKYALIPICIL